MIETTWTWPAWIGVTKCAVLGWDGLCCPLRRVREFFRGPPESVNVNLLGISARWGCGGVSAMTAGVFPRFCFGHHGCEHHARVTGVPATVMDKAPAPDADQTLKPLFLQVELTAASPRQICGAPAPSHGAAGLHVSICAVAIPSN
jgi:hypothetical protein